MKVFYTLIIVAGVAVGCGYGISASWGDHVPDDFPLRREFVLRYPEANKYWSVDVDFPLANQINKFDLSRIIVWDHFPNATGPQPALWSGGPGYRFATVQLKGEVSRGINCTVEFYGR